MNKYKHSGAFGDLIYSLPIVKHFGGGEFYLHLNQIDWIGQYYYGSPPNPVHRGRLTQQDFNFMKSFMEAQEYITKFDIMNNSVEITHNLDKFRGPFVGHPGNYIDIYTKSFNITDPIKKVMLRNNPWLTVPNPKVIDGRPVVVNRTARWLPQTLAPQWKLWKDAGIEEQAIFVGLPNEYNQFKQVVGWDIPYQPTTSMLELAEIIAGSELYIGNQSVGLALAIGLNKTISCERRQDLPVERNECYFSERPHIRYF